MIDDKTNPKHTQPLYDIEKGIPLQPVLHRTLVFPLDKMDIGDSFVIPLSKRNSLMATMTHRRRVKLPGKFVTRRISDTEVRVWRTE